jgi:LAO/AO transport system kinase
MRDLAGDSGVFIRSMATRGSLGGLARATADVTKALDAAGYQVILIETVGAGQSEVDIARTADTTLVVEAPGLGDEIQAIKAGILEIADVLVVNKADRDGADSTARALQAMLDLGVAEHKISHHGISMTVGVPHKAPDKTQEKTIWRPPILKTVALESKGIDEVIDAIEQHRQFLDTSGEKQLRVRTRLAAELDAILRETLMRQLMNRLSASDLNGLLERTLARELDPYAAVAQLLARAGMPESG